MTRIGVVALQGDIAEHAAALRHLGATPVRVRRPSDLDGLHGLVLPGGESTTIGQLATDFGLIAPLRAFVSSGRPVWGTCAGLILLADDIGLDQPLIGGLDARVARNAFGRQVDSFEVDLSIPVIGPPPFRAVFIRSPVVEHVGPSVEVLARVDDGRIVAVRQDTILATAFHPELTDDYRLHSLFMSMVAPAG